MGKKLVGLGHPLHWEPTLLAAARSVTSLEPVLVILEAEKIDQKHKRLLQDIHRLKSRIDLVVFQLRRKRGGSTPTAVDGAFVRGRSLVEQVSSAIGAMKGSQTFKASGLQAQQQLETTLKELERLRTLAVRDDLTSLYNLRFFNRSLETEHQRASRFGRSYGLIFMDLDGLREVNSRRGHLAGGRVLRHVGDFLANRIRQIDVPARIGGDEFVIICPETTKKAARLAAERLRQGIQRLTDERGMPLGITVSAGIATYPDDGTSPEEVLQRADRALYEAKALGKNRVCCWGEFEPGEDEDSFLGSVHGVAKLV
ncbi:MAG TPA: GGDEF domain-containing protein [Vicinamibacteria bacterium]|nr:GGDEF domain-containing protein [Vicinamibacteria bacterium]